MAVLLVLTLLGMASLAMGMRMVRGNGTDRKRVLSIHGADAGIEFAKHRLRSGSIPSTAVTYSGDWGNGQAFTVTVSATNPLSPVAVERTITSTGTNTSRSRTVQATMFKQLDPFRLPLFADQGVGVTGQSTIDWYDSRVGPYTGIPSPPHHAHIRSNQGISVAGGADVYGDATPGPGYTTTVCNNCFVAGSTAPATETLSYPLPDVSVPETDNDNTNICAVANDCTSGVWSPSTKTIAVSNGAKLTLRSGTYNLCRLQVSSGTGVTIALVPSDGPIRIYFSAPGTSPCGTQTDPIDIKGGTWSLPGQVAPNFQMYVRGSTTQSTAVTVKAGGVFMGGIYAPASNVTITAQGDLYGAFVGKTLSMSGGGDLHYDRALGGSGSAGTPWTQKLWLEL
jgi:hypothetical protein